MFAIFSVLILLLQKRQWRLTRPFIPLQRIKRLLVIFPLQQYRTFVGKSLLNLELTQNWICDWYHNSLLHCQCSVITGIWIIKKTFHKYLIVFWMNSLENGAIPSKDLTTSFQGVSRERTDSTPMFYGFTLLFDGTWRLSFIIALCVVFQVQLNSFKILTMK